MASSEGGTERPSILAVSATRPVRLDPQAVRLRGGLGAGVGSDCASGAVSATGSAVHSITFSLPLRRAPASISRNASSAASNCSSDIALTPPEGSTFISFGTSIAHILRYAAGCSFATFAMTFWTFPLEMLGEREQTPLVGHPGKFA